MADMRVGSGRSLRVLHVLRAPVGGLFRHVVDLAREQIDRGHSVGVIADALTGGESASRLLGELEPRLALGLSRPPMRRDPHPTDFGILAHVTGRIRQFAPDVIHGHGSKGGAYTRLTGLLGSASDAIRVYTPHGGSLNHKLGSLTHRAYMAAERAMARRTDLLLFESAFIAGRYRQLVGNPACMSRVVHNGISEQEFVPVLPREDATEFLYVGELRATKGIDTLIDALSVVGRKLGTSPRATLVGSGPDQASLTEYVRRIGLENQIRFTGPLPARTAFELGRILVVPSRAESLPYIVLEAAGARVPLIATNVGGIPEIFGPLAHRLLPPDDVNRLATRMIEALSAPGAQRDAETSELAGFVHNGFSIHTMVDSVLAAYRDALAAKAAGRAPRASEVAVSS